MKLYYLTWLLTFSLYSGFIYPEVKSQSGADKAVICSSCHGQEGLSSNQEWPNIAGQHVEYLIKELQDFKLGKTRYEPTMSAMVANLTNQDIKDISAFYSAKAFKNNEKSKENLNRGEIIYRRGDMNKHITACIACHGPNGLGNGPAGFPLLSGQNPKYTIKQLQYFKNKTRKNDLNSIMRDISLHMTKEDMQDVANYIYGLH